MKGRAGMGTGGWGRELGCECVNRYFHQVRVREFIDGGCYSAQRCASDIAVVTSLRY